jgi:hypothetical protein
MQIVERDSPISPDSTILSSIKYFLKVARGECPVRILGRLTVRLNAYSKYRFDVIRLPWLSSTLL